MRDFGGATLGLALVLGAAGIWLERRLVVVALLAYLRSPCRTSCSTWDIWAVCPRRGDRPGADARRSVVLPAALLVVAGPTLATVRSST